MTRHDGSSVVRSSGDASPDALRPEAPCVIRPHGELDLANASELGAALADALAGATDGLVVDLSDVSFLDASILSVLVAANKRARLLDRAVVISCRHRSFDRLFSITGLEATFVVHPSVEEGIASLDR